eukprot:12052620-Ditylum_brightwellii.AAC.1
MQYKNQTEIITQLQKDYSSIKDSYNQLFTNYQQLNQLLTVHCDNTNCMMGMMLELQKQTFAASVSGSGSVDNLHPPI